MPKILAKLVASEQIWVNMPYPKSSANLTLLEWHLDQKIFNNSINTHPQSLQKYDFCKDKIERHFSYTDSIKPHKIARSNSNKVLPFSPPLREWTRGATFREMRTKEFGQGEKYRYVSLIFVFANFPDVEQSGYSRFFDRETIFLYRRNVGNQFYQFSPNTFPKLGGQKAQDNNKTI